MNGDKCTICRVWVIYSPAGDDDDDGGGGGVGEYLANSPYVCCPLNHLHLCARPNPTNYYGGRPVAFITNTTTSAKIHCTLESLVGY